MARVMAVAALLLLVAVAPASHAVTPPLRFTGTMDVSIPNFLLYPENDPGISDTLASLTVTPCSNAKYHPDDQNNSFTFRESAEETACLRVIHNLTMPAGTRQVQVFFAANRSVQPAVPGSRVSGMTQVVQVQRSSVDTIQSFTVFPMDAPSRNRTNVNFTFNPYGETNLQIVWYFEDQDLVKRRTRTTAGGAFSATVWEPEVRLDGIPLGNPHASNAHGNLEGKDYVQEYTVELRVPDAYRAAASTGRFALHLEMDGQSEAIRVQAPGGEDLARSAYETTIAGGVSSLTIPASTVHAFSDRTEPFQVHIKVSEELPGQGTFTFLAYVALLAPGATITAAWIGLRRTELGPRMEG